MTHAINTSIRAGLAALCLMTLGACSTAESGHTENNIIIGTAVGATTGTVATVVTGGCIPCGAAIGGASGAGAGYVYDWLNRQPGR
jgi:osmotically inducible lipoprotein OsmB